MKDAFGRKLNLGDKIVYRVKGTWGETGCE